MINIISQLPRNGTQDTPHNIGGITHLICHHDAQWRPEAYDDLTRYIQQANFHIGRGEDGLQYHYKISNLGDVYQCRNWTDTLWHCGNYPVNRASIAICLDGDFTQQQPTAQQLSALQGLLDELCTQHPEFPADSNDVFGHGEVGASACPGFNLLPSVQKYRNGGSISVVAPPTPPPVQDPPVVAPKFWRVYDANGTQVGAYSSQGNAQNKLDTLEAGSIKDPDGNIVGFKDKPIVVVEPPFIGDPILDPPETPTTPPVDPIIPTPSITPPTPEKPVITPQNALQALWGVIIQLFKRLFGKK